MVTRTAWLTVVLLLFGAAMSSTVAGKGTAIVGTITRLDQNSMEVTTWKARTLSVNLDANTIYRKWIAPKVWRLDAGRSLLRVGGLVQVDVSTQDPALAVVVYIR